MHESPSPDKLESFVNYLKHVGVGYTRLLSDDATGRDYAAVLDEAGEKGIGTMCYNRLTEFCRFP